MKNFNNLKGTVLKRSVQTLPILAMLIPPIQASAKKTQPSQEIQIKETISFFSAQCSIDKGLPPDAQHHQDTTGIAAFGSTILSGVIQDGIVRIKVHAIGYRCESVTEGANEFVWRPVSLVGNSRVQPLLQTTSGKYHKLVFENPRNALFEAPVDKFFNSSDLEAFLSGANLGRRHFDIVYIVRDENGRIKNNYVPASRRYVYELVPSNNGTFELKIALAEK